jgi:hypothetical protein
MGGPSFYPPVPKTIVTGASIRGTWLVTKDDPSTWRRSIYANIKRNLKYPMFDVFDQPNASLSCERRDVTTVATQALTLFNNETFLIQSQDLASRIEKEAGTDPAAQVKLLYRIAYSREASAKELQQGQEFLNKRLATDKSSSQDETTKLWLTPLAEFAHVIMNSNEFVYIN